MPGSIAGCICTDAGPSSPCLTFSRQKAWMAEISNERHCNFDSMIDDDDNVENAKEFGNVQICLFRS